MDKAFVIGMGEVGTRLASTLEAAGWTVAPVRRESGWPEALDVNDPALRILAVREEQLQGLLDRFPAELLERLVLVQNGFLEAVHGELGPVNRGLIYFTSKGDFFRVLCPTPFCGPHGVKLAEAVERGGIPTETFSQRRQFLEAMIVKGIWNAVVGLPLAVHDVDLATYLTDQRGELEALVEESARAAGVHYDVAVDGTRALQKILDTTGALGWVRGGKKALAWRNGAIAWFGRRYGIPTPVNDRLLLAAGHDPERDPGSEKA